MKKKELPFEQWFLEGTLGLIAFLTPLLIFPKAYDYILIKLVVVQFLLLLHYSIWFFTSLKRKEISFIRIPISLLLLLIWFIVSTFTSQYRYVSSNQLLVWFTYTFLFFALANWVRNEGALWRFLCFWLSGSALAIIYGLITFFSKKTDVLTSTFGNPNFYGAYLVLITPVIIASIIYKKENRFLKGLLLLLAGISLFSLYLTSSQGAWVGFAVSLLVLFFLHRRRILTTPRKKLILGVLSLIIALVLVCGVHFSPSGVWEGLVRNIQEGTLNIRLHIWRGTLRMIGERPITGWGAGTFYIVYPRFRDPSYFKNPHSVPATRHAHNEYLELASELGIVGVGLFICFLGSLFRLASKSPDGEGGKDGRRELNKGFIAGVSGLLAHNVVSVNLRFPTCAIFLWITLGLIAASSGERKEVKFSSPGFGRIIIFALLSLTAASFFQFKSSLWAQIYLKNGITLKERGDFSGAIREYKKALRQDPYFPRALYRLAYVYARRNEWEKAILTYERLREIAPDYAQIHFNLGTLYLRQKRWNKAVKELERSLSLNPYYAQTYSNLGLAYEEMGKMQEAIRIYREGIKRIPQFPGVYNSLGNAYYLRGDFLKASQYYREAFRLAPRNTGIGCNLGVTYLKMGKLKEAKEVLSKLREINPGDKKVKKLQKVLEEKIEK